MSFMLVRELRTLEGYKIIKGKAVLANSDTVAKDVTATITIPQVNYVIDILGVNREDMNNSGVVAKVGGETNQVVVTAQSVPAQSTTYIGLTILGY